MFKQRIFYYTSIAIITLGVLLTIFVTGLLTFPYKVVDIKTPIPVLNKNKEVRIGEPVELEYDFCRHTDKTFTVTPVLQGPIQVSYPSFEAQGDTGCRVVISNTTKIQPYTPPGIYKLKIVSQAQMNPLRSITVTSFSEEFNVIE
jgi:hypothetical protein